jgi:hypothetical protein
MDATNESSHVVVFLNYTLSIIATTFSLVAALDILPQKSPSGRRSECRPCLMRPVFDNRKSQKPRFAYIEQMRRIRLYVMSPELY